MNIKQKYGISLFQICNENAFIISKSTFWPQQGKRTSKVVVAAGLSVNYECQKVFSLHYLHPYNWMETSDIK